MRNTEDSIHYRLQKLLGDLGTLACDAAQLRPVTDLYATGLTSLASVDLMLAIERDFGFLFPDELLNRRTFASIGAIADVIRRLGREPEAVA